MDKDVIVIPTGHRANLEVNWNANNNGNLFLMIDDDNNPYCSSMCSYLNMEQAKQLRDFLNQLPL